MGAILKCDEMGLCSSHPQTESRFPTLGRVWNSWPETEAHENNSQIPAVSHCAAHYYPGPKHKHVICVIKRSSMLQQQPLPSSPHTQGLTHLISDIKRTFVTFFRLCNTVGPHWHLCSISVKVSERSMLAENPAKS